MQPPLWKNPGSAPALILLKIRTKCKNDRYFPYFETLCYSINNSFFRSYGFSSFSKSVSRQHFVWISMFSRNRNWTRCIFYGLVISRFLLMFFWSNRIWIIFFETRYLFGNSITFWPERLPIQFAWFEHWLLAVSWKRGPTSVCLSPSQLHFAFLLVLLKA